ncbi:MAG: NB-ARC domain-containing protein, partial [Alphaproteobacteria bacterium]|nr:NB-ARC domain-containing protein [Alphaproteobacteria bacterium]
MHTLQPHKYLEYISIINAVNLTLREIDVIACVFSGRATKVMSQVLGIEPRTYETHFSNIKKKLGVFNKDQLFELLEYHSHVASYKHHVWLLKMEQSLEIILKKQHLEPLNIYCFVHKKFSKIFFDLLKRHFKIFNIHVHLRIAQDSDNVLQDYFVLSFDDQIAGNNTVKVRYQNQSAPCAKDVISFSDYDHYFDVLVALAEKIRPHMNITYIKQKIQEDYNKHLEMMPRPMMIPNKKDQSWVKNLLSMGTRLQKNMIFGVILSVITAGTMVVQSVSHQMYFQNNLKSVHIIGCNNAFLKRDQLMSAIKKILSRQHKFGADRIAYILLVGLSGSGKTTLASHYAEKYHKNCAWQLNAQSIETLKQSYFQLAYMLSTNYQEKNELLLIAHIHDSRVAITELLTFVQKRLVSKPNWILIFDNVVNFQEIADLIPQSAQSWGKGNVVITTTNSNLMNTHFTPQQSMTIPPLTQEEAQDLFSLVAYKTLFKYAPRKEKEMIKLLLEKIPLMPLDLMVAGHYIRYTQMPISRYVDSLFTQARKFKTSQEFLHKELSISEDRIALLSLAFNQITQIDKQFERLLFALSLLNFKYIPKRILVYISDEETASTFILALKKFSLIIEETLPSVDPEERFISIHPFILDFYRHYCMQTLPQDQQQKMAKNLSNAFEKYVQNHRKEHEFLSIALQHLQPFIDHINANIDQQTLSQLYLSLGWAYYHGTRELTQAKQSFEQGLKHIHTKDVNHDHIRFVYLKLAHLCND